MTQYFCGVLKWHGYNYCNDIRTLGANEVFVFGSNLMGHHGGGAARAALDKFGAIWGVGVGIQGQSYAIPTMQGPVETIRPYVDQFMEYVADHPGTHFLVTAIGTNWNKHKMMKNATIMGAIAAAFYGGMSDEVYRFTIVKLPTDLREIVDEFEERMKA